MSRTETVFENGEIISQSQIDITWSHLRAMRNSLLEASDWRAVSDREMAEEWVSFRQFLRDLPQDFTGDDANDAYDALDDYDKPEGA